MKNLSSRTASHLWMQTIHGGGPWMHASSSKELQIAPFLLTEPPSYPKPRTETRIETQRIVARKARTTWGGNAKAGASG